MKKFLALIFSGALILGTCGNNDASNNDSDTKSESKTEKKSEDKKDNKSKEDKKSKEEKKSQESEDDKSTQENNSTEEQNTQETATNEQQTVTQEQPSTQKQTNNEQHSQQSQNTQQSSNNQSQYSDEYLANNPVSTDGQLTPEEQQRYDEGMKEIERLEQKNQELSDPTYDPNNPYMNMPDQEWRNNAGGLSSGEIQTRNEILKGTYEGEDAQQKLDAINYYEEKYSN
ncbi:hypothetical protein [Staphylococcus hominis]